MSADLDNKPLNGLSRWHAKTPVSARHLNEAVDVLNEQRRGIEPPRQVPMVAGGAAAVTALQLKLVFVRGTGYGTRDNTIRCSTDPTSHEPADDLIVAKPYDLRKCPWHYTNRPWIGHHGTEFYYNYLNAYRRVVTVPPHPTYPEGLEELQRITPHYRDRDPLLIMRLPPELIWNPTDLVAAEAPDLVDVVWMDMNLCGRSWASEIPED